MRPLHLIAPALLTLPLLGGCFTVETETTFVDLSAMNFDRVVINGSSGEIDVSVGDKPSLSAFATYSPKYRPDIIVDNRGGTLELTYDCNPLAITCSVDLDVVLPGGRPLVVDSSSGSVKIKGIGAAVDVTASSGAVHVTDVVGPVSVDASSGSVGVQGVDDDVWVRARSGAIDVNDVLGNVEVSASSGSVDLDGIAGNVLAETSSGRLRGVNLSGQDVEVDASSGSVELDFITKPSAVVVDSSSGSVSLGVPQGNYRVEAETSSGSVSVTGIVQDPGAASFLFVDASSGDVAIFANN